MNTCVGESCLQGYLEESGPSPLRRMVEAHMISCAGCRVAFERVVATHQRVNGWLARLCSPGEIAAMDERGALADVLERVEGRRRFFVVGEDLGRRNPRAFVVSVAVQSCVVAVLMLLGTGRIVRDRPAPFVLVAPPRVVRPLESRPSHRGGGGGQRAPLPVSKGELPGAAVKAYVPLAATVSHPLLTMEPSLIAPADAWAVPATIGMPSGIPGQSGGPGSNVGLGDGDRGRIGNGHDVGFPGDDGPGIVNPGNGISAPQLISKVDPEYSEEARKARYGGAVTLSIVVNTDGRAESIRVVKSVGMGLDERAIEAVRQWRFRPGVNHGVPVKVRAQVEVTFRLL